MFKSLIVPLWEKTIAVWGRLARKQSDDEQVEQTTDAEQAPEGEIRRTQLESHRRTPMRKKPRPKG